MTDPARGERTDTTPHPERIAAAPIRTRQRPSIIWLIPVVALLAGLFVAWRAFSERGPEITIRFSSAEGLEAGKTKIKYKDVELGLVEEVRLAPDLAAVICRARMVNGAEDYLHEKTRFWIVKARVAGGQVTGLGTLLSGSYIGMEPVLEGRREREFSGLEVPPVVTQSEPGRYFVLRSKRAGAIDVGSPVYFRKIQVGQVVSSQLDAADDFVTTRVFVRSPYDARVHADSRFWNASGIDASIGADGVKIDTQSIVSILVGGIAFDTPDHGLAAEAEPETVFTLFENRDAADRPNYTRSAAFLLHFHQSVRGLSVGAPVEFQGIPIGQVTGVKLEFEPASEEFRVPVTIEVEPQRIANLPTQEVVDRERLDRLVAAGLRAQLKSGNLLTGQLVVSLDLHEKTPPAKIVWDGPLPELPTVGSPIEEITASLARLADRLGRVPVDKIGSDLQKSLAELKDTLAQTKGAGPALTATLQQAERALASTNAMIGPDSGMNEELRRALLELSQAARALELAAQQIQTQPDSIIFGRKGSR